jgi:signal transduction histidine kinase
MSFKTIRNVGFVLLIGIIIVLCLFTFRNYYKIQQALNTVISFETPVRERSERITRILTETKNSFELYIHREKIEYSDVLNHMNHLIDKSIALEQFLDEKQHLSDSFIEIRVLLDNMERESAQSDSDLRYLLRDLTQKRFSDAYKQIFNLKRHLKKIPEDQRLLVMNHYAAIRRIFRETFQSFTFLINKAITVNDVIVPLERVVAECEGLKSLVGESEKNAIEKLSKNIKHLKGYIANYVTQERVLDDTSDTLILMQNTVMKIREDVQKSLFEMQKRVNDRIEKDHNYMFTLLEEVKKLMISGMIVAIIVAIATVIIASRALMKPISQLMIATQRLATGDLNFRVNISTKDEIGKLAKSLNQMAENLKKITVSRDKLRETQAQLVQASKLASIGELSAGIAHELNQPLMVIDTGIQLISRSITKNKLDHDKLLEDMQLFSRNTKRMMHIINHLRTFSRQSEGKSFEPVHIQQIIEDALSMISEQLRLKSIHIKKIFPERIPGIKGDANQLEQVFINLLTNARDAILDTNASGTIEIKIEVKTDLKISIKDSGTGIASDKLPRIFDPFFTTKDIGKGTGLGLSISYGIIKDHHGDIVVSETGNNGTIFVISLPVYRNDNNEFT